MRTPTGCSSTVVAAPAAHQPDRHPGHRVAVGGHLGAGRAVLTPRTRRPRRRGRLPHAPPARRGTRVPGVLFHRRGVSARPR
ncbi:hypothetical protein HBB16_01195 [Pseudonocardia sp. MCCB 268]|nr:hypothetical protein [Pseudonocardia cytotoxica]